MLKEYKESQPIAYTILKNALKNNKYAHAYIFEDNFSNDALSLALAFVKELLTQNKLEEEKENIVSMIDTDNHPEVKKIISDGLWIKKDQIKNLQDEFSKKPVYGDKKVYIIEEAEKLNKSSSNTILKFLEEPEEGIIAILITKNVYQILETVRSRCQLIKLINHEDYEKDSFPPVFLTEELINEEKQAKMNSIISFVHYYEKNHLETICYMQKLWHTCFSTKELSLLGFDLLILYYKDILNYMVGHDMCYFKSDKENIDNLFKFQTPYEISKKIEIITQLKEKIKANANLNLLMDKLIIELEGVIE